MPTSQLPQSVERIVDAIESGADPDKVALFIATAWENMCDSSRRDQVSGFRTLAIEQLGTVLDESLDRVAIVCAEQVISELSAERKQQIDELANGRSTARSNGRRLRRAK